MNKKLPAKFRAQLEGGDVYQYWKEQKEELLKKTKKNEVEKRLNQIFTEQAGMALELGSQEMAEKAVQLAEHILSGTPLPADHSQWHIDLGRMLGIALGSLPEQFLKDIFDERD